MEDMKFLQECGIAIDPLWLAEVMSHEVGPEASNYMKSLMRIADILPQSQQFDFGTY